MSTTWYKANLYCLHGDCMLPAIEAVEIDREHKNSLVVLEEDGKARTFKKISNYYHWFKTWQEAKVCLVGFAVERAQEANAAAIVAELVLTTIEGLKEENV